MDLSDHSYTYKWPWILDEIHENILFISWENTRVKYIKYVLNHYYTHHQTTIYLIYNFNFWIGFNLFSEEKNVMLPMCNVLCAVNFSFFFDQIFFFVNCYDIEDQ